MAESAAAVAAMRLDKWLWHARACRTRTAASKLAGSGQVRVNGQVTDKAHLKVRQGDVLTFPQGDHIRIWRIVDLAERRGSAPIAQQLYEDLKPPTADNRITPAQPPRSPRPDARDRRRLRALSGKQG
ncbi:MAG: RNA-binding S4 domain-containing protein [Kiloniellales bacterium]